MLKGGAKDFCILSNGCMYSKMFVFARGCDSRVFRLLSRVFVCMVLLSLVYHSNRTGFCLSSKYTGSK